MSYQALAASAILLTSLQAAPLLPLEKTNSLVVYNANLGLVHEERALSLDKGRQKIVYDNVASTVVTDSVNVHLPSDVTLYSQKYRYDKITLQKLLEAHLNQEVEVKIHLSNEKYEIKKARLLSAGHNAMIALGDGSVMQVNAADIIFKTIPKSLITKPSLVWDVSSSKEEKGRLQIDYIINNISWKSDYVLNVQKNRANLSGWMSINNNSGKAFKDVKLKVLAGEISRESRPVRPRHVYAAMQEDSARSPAVKELGHEGYHLYSIPFRVDIEDKEKTQIKFIDVKDIKIDRRYEVSLSSPRWLRSEKKHQVNQYFEFKDLPNPLPQGVIRTYSSLEDTSLLLGVNTISHTPKKEKISLMVGKNFDLVVKEAILRRSESKRYYEAEVKYTLINRSRDLKKLELLIPFVRRSAGESLVISDTKHSFKEGNTLLFELDVKPDEIREFKVKYRNRP